ncbi:hypothetical protein BpHYR1_029727 [Brachionus plicatilis]|uniref:Uncharacterized protein n=1 Tax=Brachionus plicatilis TaxID=10195 RepID=A0A3M7QRB1_BRAPC|nr:hypothetical protein BpHYR1_029727 [Brachionus plicatilis]
MRNKLALVMPLWKTKSIALHLLSFSPILFLSSILSLIWFVNGKQSFEAKWSATSVPMLTTAPPIPHAAPKPLAATIEIPPVNGASKSAPTNRPAPAVDTDVPTVRATLEFWWIRSKGKYHTIKRLKAYNMHLYSLCIRRKKLCNLFTCVELD